MVACLPSSAVRRELERPGRPPVDGQEVVHLPTAEREISVIMRPPEELQGGRQASAWDAEEDLVLPKC